MNAGRDRKSTRLNSSHTVISYAVFCLKKKKKMSTAWPDVQRIAKYEDTKKPPSPSRWWVSRRSWIFFVSGVYCTESVPIFFFFNDTATTEIYTLSLHDALPIYANLRVQKVPSPPVHFLERIVWRRSEEHTSELQSHSDLVCRLLLEKKKI